MGRSPARASTNPAGGDVKSAHRALEILELLTRLERPATFVELESELGFPRSSLHGLLKTMLNRGWLETHDGGYALGIKNWESGNAYLRARSLAERALPVMQRVRDLLDETVQLAVLDGTENIYIGKVSGSHRLTLASEVGRRLDAHATGLGKALLSGLTDQDIDELYADHPLRRFTDVTITNLDDLKAAVRKAETDGYAVDDEEYTVGVRCVAVPIRGQTSSVVAAMSVSIPTVRADEARMANTLTHLRDGAAEISAKLGHRTGREAGDARMPAS